MKSKFLSPILFAVLCVSSVQAMFAPLITIPIDRMVEDLKARREAEPDNALWTYRLGRSYYLAFETGAGAAFSFHPREAGKGFPDEEMLAGSKRQLEQQKNQAEGGNIDLSGMPRDEEGWTVKVLTGAERIAYAEKAYAELKKAVEMAPDNGLYFLTLGSFQQNWLESGLEAPDSLKEITPLRTLEAYEKAWRLSRKEDLARRHLPIHGEGGLHSKEAAKAWLKLAESVEQADADTAAEMKEDLNQVSGLRMGVITPLIFHPAGELQDPVPVNSKASVSFDLVGDGSGGRWTWPKKGVAFLVWQPVEDEKITSGKQLFGGYTWQMLWEHGFEPLAVLDVDRDGRLSGEELKGLAAWFDEKPLGISDPKELVPLSKLGVKALHLRHEGYPGPDALQWNRAGMEFEDGSLVPVWDWLADPVD